MTTQNAPKLNIKHRAFIEHYLINGMNATRAAIAAGYSEDSAHAQGHRLLKNAEIKAEIERLFSERVMSKDEILARLTEHARGDIGDVLDENGNVDWKLARRMGKTGLIKRVKRTISTSTDEGGNGRETFTDEIELHDPQKALQLLGKFYKLWVDRTEVSGNDGAPIEFKITFGNPDVDPDTSPAPSPQTE